MLNHNCYRIIDNIDQVKLNTSIVLTIYTFSTSHFLMYHKLLNKYFLKTKIIMKTIILLEQAVRYRTWVIGACDLSERGLQWQTEAVYSRLQGTQSAQSMCTGADRGCTGDDRENTGGDRERHGIFIRFSKPL